jgi:arylsulfatase A-like enzyme
MNKLKLVIALFCIFVVSTNTTLSNGWSLEWSNQPESSCDVREGTSYKEHLNEVANRPNIIVILLDDLGYGDLGNFWQNQLTGDQKMATPVLDKLANEGAMMTHHYTAAPVCSPARCSLLEGLHQGHASIRDNQFDKAAKNGLTMAEMLSIAGYHTMHVGKNGNAGKMGSDLEGHPLKRGFDQFFGYLFHKQGHIHYPLNGTTNKEAYFTDGFTPILEGTELTYTTDVFTAKSKQWIIEHERMQSDQPFFLYLAYDVPHKAYQVPTQAYPAGGGLHGGVQWTGKDSSTPWVNTASGMADTFIHPDYASKGWEVTEKKFATMIRRVDNAVQDILQLLVDLNIDQETMIVFSSDNGPTNAGHEASFFQSYANLNGIKRDMWEGGIKMPTICYYPGVVPAGSEVVFPSGHWDWLATFADLAKVPIPAYTDGVSLLPVLMQKADQQIDKGYVYQEYSVGGATPEILDFDASKRGRKRGQMQVVRMGDYKGVRYDIQSHATPFEIYDVVNDPRESNNLASSMPVLHQRMKDKALQVRKVDASAPRPYDDELIPGSEVSNVIKGLSKSVYQGKCAWVPDFRYLTPIHSLVSANIDMSAEGLLMDFGIAFTGFIDIPTDGTYTFSLESASRCHVMLHEIHLLDNDFEYVSEEVASTVKLKAGKHPIRIYYQQNEKKISSLRLKWQGPGISKEIIPDTMFYTSENVNSVVLSGEESVYLGLRIQQPVTSNGLQLRLQARDANVYQAALFSLSGQRLSAWGHGLQVYPGLNSFCLPIRDLPSGLYVLRLQSDLNHRFLAEKFIIQ